MSLLSVLRSIVVQAPRVQVVPTLQVAFTHISTNGYVFLNAIVVVQTVIAPVVLSIHLVPDHTVPHCTHTSAPKSTSLFTLVSKSVALVQDQPDTHKYIPFSAHAV